MSTIKTVRSTLFETSSIKSAEENEQDVFSSQEKNSGKKSKEYDDPASISQAKNSPHIKLYLRFKSAHSNTSKLTIDNEGIYNILNPNTLLVKFPSVADKYRISRIPNSVDPIIKRFYFTEIFDVETSQINMFERCAKSVVVNFLAGQSSTIMTYGASNSGKTHSLYGTSSSPGLIPRSIEHIFSCITCSLFPWYKTTRSDRVVSLNAQNWAEELRNKIHLLNSGATEENRRVEDQGSPRNSCSGSLIDEPEEYTSEAMYSVWLSFLEIYNENVYDLLAVDNRDRGPPLKLITDKDGTVHARNARTVYATSALEARQVLVIGQSRSSVATTDSNSKSSRSHTILILKLLKYQKEDAPDEVRVSTLTFCDLAAGRSRDSQETGVHMIESRSINNSLLVLGRCLKNARDSYSSKQNLDQVAGPFRESKLTRMFQRPLSGRESLILIVSIDPSRRRFAETQGVLHLCATMKKLVPEYASLKDTRESGDWEIALQSPESSSAWETATLSSPAVTPEKSGRIHSEERETLKEENERLIKELEYLKAAVLNYETSPGKNPRKLQSSSIFCYEAMGRNEFVDLEDYRALKAKNERLARELDSARADALNREIEVRRELVDQYSGIVKELEESWRERAKQVENEGQDLLTWSVNQVENFYKERIDSIIRGKKRKRTDDGDFEDSNRLLYKELEAENAQITSKVVVLRETVKKLKEENAIIVTERNKTSFELALLKEELKDFQELAMNSIDDLDINNEDDYLRPVDRLKYLIDDKTKHIEMLEKDFNEVKNYCIEMSTNVLKTEQELPETQVTLKDVLLRNKDLEIELIEKTQPNKIKSLDVSENAQENAIMRDNRIARGLKDLSIFSSLYHLNNNPNFNKSKLTQSSIRELTRRSSSIVDTDFGFGNEMTDKNLVIQAHVDTKIMRSPELEVKNRGEEFSITSDRGSFPDSCRSVDFEAFRLSNGSIKDDSGIGIDSSIKSQRSTNISDSFRETSENSTQTFSPCKEKESLCPDEYETLKVNYNILKTQHIQEVLRAVQLTRELKRVKEALHVSNQAVEVNKSKVQEYEAKISSQMTELKVFKESNRTITSQLNDLQRSFEGKIQRYEKKTGELLKKLEIMEENESRTSRCLQGYIDECASLEKQLSMLRLQLQDTSIKYNSEALAKIESLEKELLERALQIKRMDERMIETQHDLLRVHDLYQKVQELEILLRKCETEKKDCLQQLQEQLATQSALECTLQKLCDKIQDREQELIQLRKEITNLSHTSISNMNDMKDLSKRIIEANRSVNLVHEELSRSEELRRNIEQTSKQEICTLKSRLAVFEKNAAFLNFIQDSKIDKQEEIDRLNTEIREKEREMSLFRRNQEAMIDRYEALVNDLQMEVEKTRIQTPKLRPEFYKEKLQKFEGKGCSKFEVLEMRDTFTEIRESIKDGTSDYTRRVINVDALDSESTSSDDHSSIKQSQILDDMSASVHCCTSPRIQAHDPRDVSSTDRSYEAGCHVSLGKVNIQTQIDENYSMNSLCKLCSMNIEERISMSGWMKIKKVDVRTSVALAADEVDSDISGEESESEWS